MSARRLAGGLALLLAGCTVTPPDEPVDAPLRYTGSPSCRECHEKETAAWLGSQHELAMQGATPETVLGDFDDASFEYAGTVSTFFRDGERFRVRTESADGSLRDYDVAYTYGVTPLQQYLIAFPDGRVQALNICWDTRPAAAGGQRWFHLYPADSVLFDDPLHWTGVYQNWNHMCAECHSTGVKKGYDAATDTFHTTWTEIHVGCEACHGPGSHHIAWARRRDEGDPRLTIRSRSSERGAWAIDPETGIAKLVGPGGPRPELDMCGRCHVRRSWIHDDGVPGDPLLDTHLPTLLEPGLYTADGRIVDEVYVWGSFLQSRMYAAGVTCTDCHDPHRPELLENSDAACSKCHLESKFATRAHHFHPEGKGDSCVECHMPPRSYMVVDPRHDHGFRIPRPDLVAPGDPPDACTLCHADRGTEWCAERVVEWYRPERPPHWGEAIAAGRNGTPGFPARLHAQLEDPDTPGIVRATLLGLLPAGGTQADAIARALRDPDPVVRLGAATALDGAPAEVLPPLLRVALSDSLRAVRLRAVDALVGSGPLEDLSLMPLVNAALVEAEAMARFEADRPEGQVRLGNLRRLQNDPAGAEAAYRRAIEIAPALPLPYAALSDLLREQRREPEAARLLRDGLQRAPDSALLHHVYGLALVRLGGKDEALGPLRRATELEPGDPRYAFVLAIGLTDRGRGPEALAVLERALAARPGDPDLLFALTTISRDVGDTTAARRWAARFLEVWPDDPRAVGLGRELGLH